MDLFKFLKEVKAALPVVANVESKVWLVVAEQQLFICSEWTHVDKRRTSEVIAIVVSLDDMFLVWSLDSYFLAFLDRVRADLHSLGFIEAPSYA